MGGVTMPDINEFRAAFWKSWNSNPRSDSRILGGLRKGQHLYNFALRYDVNVAPDHMTEDPYYKDENIDRFFAYLEKRWNTGSS